MRMLRPDSFSRRAIIARRDGLRPGLLFFLLFVSVALLFLSRLQHGQITELRLQLAELMAPALKAALVPLEPVRRAGQRVAASFELLNELDRLKAENQRLRSWEWRARETERRANQLARIARVVEEPGLSFATARVVADSSGPFVRSAMLAGGRDEGMKAGYPVIDANGLVGRVVETSARVSRVLLVTDINSRIPVQVGRSGARAVLAGDNGAAPKLGYLQPAAEVEAGDEVYTSGTGGLFPRGLRIGKVIDDGGVLRVVPHAQLEDLDYVSVLFFENPALELVEDDKASRGRDAPARRSSNGRATIVQGAGTP
jgi:rod shape-determining protein MreC